MPTKPDDGRKAPGSAAMALIAAALIATAANGALRSGSIVSVPVVRHADPARHAWSQDHVRELIALVEESRSHGLDPDDFGLAALRSELDQSASFYRADGSRQLDALARASAIALARAYHRQGTLDDTGLTAALRTNSLRAWIGAPAVAIAERS